jgi:hypothetical protein
MISPEKLVEKINSLPPAQQSEIIDFVEFVARRRNADERFQLISEYASANAGTDHDLDPELENAGIECLLAVDEAAK